VGGGGGGFAFPPAAAAAALSAGLGFFFFGASTFITESTLTSTGTRSPLRREYASQNNVVGEQRRAIQTPSTRQLS
jgi:hypothetical protein